MIFRFARSRDLQLIACLAFILYFGLALIKPSGIFWSLDEGGKWIYLENVLRTGNPSAALIYPGRELDSTLGNVPIFFSLREGDQIYSWWPIGFPLITLPFYKLMGWGGLYLLPALGGAVIVLLSGLIVKMLNGQSCWAADTAAALVALATPVAYYSMTFWEHTLSTACVLMMAYLLLLNREQFSWRLLLLAGAMGSLAVFFRQEAGLIALGFGLIFLLTSWRKTIPFAVGGFLTAAAWIAVNLWITGNILGPNGNASQAMSLFNGMGVAGKKFIPYLLFNAPLVGAFAFNKWLLAIATVMAFLTALLGLWKKTRLFSALLLIATTLVCAYVLLQPSLYRSVHSVLITSSPSARNSTPLWRERSIVRVIV
ncbi:MAG TPA: hypothetical protein VHO90_20825 [Bacteroidales bacterium]|nr:hypothetical protein [Bacteroidales bacterium]